MVHVNEIDKREVELEHLDKLKGSGYDLSCSGCGYMYRKPVRICEHCDSKSFTPTTEVIRKLELNLE